MTGTATILVALAIVILVGIVGEVLFRRTSIPDALWLVLTGIALGPVGGLVTPAQLARVAPVFAAITLVVVLFQGGSRLRLDALARGAGRSTILATAAFLSSTLALALLSMPLGWAGLLPGWTFQHGLLLGAILGGSSSVIIMPAMEAAGVDEDLAGLVNLESAFTDVLCVVIAAALIDIMAGQAGASSSLGDAALPGGAGGEALRMALEATATLTGDGGAAGGGGSAMDGAGLLAGALARSLAVGAGIGAVAAILWYVVLRLIGDTEHSFSMTLAAMLLLYVMVDAQGGSAALGILVFAVMMGNARSITARLKFIEPVELSPQLLGVHTQMAFLVKTFFFVFIGAALGPPWGHVLAGVLFAGVIVGVRVGLLRLLGKRVFDLEGRGRRIVEACHPRGLAAGVLATLPASSGVEGTESLPTLVFAAIVASILAFTAMFYLASRSDEETPTGDASPSPSASSASSPSASSASSPSASSASSPSASSTSASEGSSEPAVASAAAEAPDDAVVSSPSAPPSTK